MAEIVHAKTPNISPIRYSDLSAFVEIPGIGHVQESKNGRPTKAQNLAEALNRTCFMQLLRCDADGRGFSRLRVDGARMKLCIDNNGGSEVFGGWADWGDVLSMRDR